MNIGRIDNMKKGIRIEIQPRSQFRWTVIIVISTGNQCHFIGNGTDSFEWNYFCHLID
jgi:hypothetical protein